MKPDAKFKSELKSRLSDLMRFAQHQTKRKDIAEELVQDTITHALHNWKDLEPGAKMTPWLYVIMQNIRMSESRKERVRKKLMSGHVDQVSALADQYRALPSHLDKLALREVGKAIEALPVEQKEALYLIIEGHSYDEVGKILDIRIGTVRSRVSRARERLGEVLGDEIVLDRKRSFVAG